MKNPKISLSLLIVSISLLISVPAQSQWVTIARKIKGMITPQTDVATVMLDAKPFKVYNAVMDTLSSDHTVTIIKVDKAKRKVEFTKSGSGVTMQVDSLAVGLSQITVAAPHSGDNSKTTSLAVDAIFRVCKKAGIKCTLSD